MGNPIFSQPLFERVEDPERLSELMLIRIGQLQETYHYVCNTDLLRKNTLNLEEFVDVFGNLMDDAELHFSYFRISELPICDTMEVLCSLALLSCDAMRNKVEFLFNLHTYRRSSKMKGTGLYLLLRRLFTAMSRIMHLPAIDNITLSAQVNSLLTSYVDRGGSNLGDLPSAAVVAAEEKEDHLSYLISNNAIRFTFSQFYQYLQESQGACTFMEEISSFCSRSLASNPKWILQNPGILLRESLAAELSPNKGKTLEFGENSDSKYQQHQPYYLRPRHPLWSFNVVDIMQESWFSTTPSGSLDDHIFTILERLVLSDRRALPVFLDPPLQQHHHTTTPASASFMAGKSPGSKKLTTQQSGISRGAFFRNDVNPHDFSTVIGNNAGTPFASIPASHISQHSKHHYKQSVVLQPHYVGIVDFWTILAWLALNIPDTLTNRVAAEERKRREQVRHQYELDVALSGVHRQGSVDFKRSSSISNVESMSGKQDLSLKAGTAASRMQWQFVGEVIATTSVKDAMTGILNNGFIFDAAVSKEFLSSHSLSGLHSTGLNQSHVISTTAKRSELLHKFSGESSAMSGSASVLQADQFLYDVVLLIAQGHRSIPISFHHDKPNTPSLVITDVEVVAFLRENAAEVLGSLAKIPISKCDFLKKAVQIKSSANLGSALYTMACRNVDTVIILDSNGKIACRLSSDIVKRIWMNWKIQMSSEPVNIVDLKRLYESGSYSITNGSSGSVFSMFSCLLTPLRNCEEFGIHVINFDKFINDSNHSDNESDNDDEEHSESSSSSDNSDDERDKTVNRFELPELDVGDFMRSSSPAMHLADTGFADSMLPRSVETPSTPRGDSYIRSKLQSAASVRGSDNKGPSDMSHDINSINIQLATTPKPPSSAQRRSVHTPSGIRTPNQGGRRLVKNPNSPGKGVGRNQSGKGKKKSSKLKKKKKRKQRIEVTEAERMKRLNTWFRELGAVQLSDTLNLALEAMHHVGSTRAIVTNVHGEVLGVVSIVDICRELITQEAQLKSVQLSTMIKGER